MSVVTPASAGSPASASQYNGLLAAWDPYTPSVFNMTLGNGSVAGRYYQQGKKVVVRIVLTPGTTTTYGGGAQIQISVPVAAQGTAPQFLPMRLATAGGGYMGAADLNPSLSATNLYLAVPTSATDCRLVAMTNGSPNPGTTGYLYIEGTYEAA